MLWCANKYTMKCRPSYHDVVSDSAATIAHSKPAASISSGRNAHLHPERLDCMMPHHKPTRAPPSVFSRPLKTDGSVKTCLNKWLHVWCRLPMAGRATGSLGRDAFPQSRGRAGAPPRRRAPRQVVLQHVHPLCVRTISHARVSSCRNVRVVFRRSAAEVYTTGAQKHRHGLCCESAA